MINFERLEYQPAAELLYTAGFINQASAIWVGLNVMIFGLATLYFLWRLSV